MNALDFTFHGARIRVESEDEEAIRFVESDFSLFLDAPGAPPDAASYAPGAGPDITVRLHYSEPPWDSIAGRKRVWRTKDADVYRIGGVLYYDSRREVLVVYDPKRGQADIHTADRDLLYEKAYLMIVTRAGALLDAKGIHRIHAMGVEYEGRAALCLMNMGGGKTTLALSLMKKNDFRLLSEEIPLVTRRGSLLPMPIRIGVLPDFPHGIPASFTKPFQRRRYGPKTLIDTRYFEDRIAGETGPGVLFVGRRTERKEPRILPVSRMKAFRTLFQLCVAGSGLPQLLEYVIRFDFGDPFRQIPIHWSRLMASIRLVRGSETFELLLGTDIDRNAEEVARFLRARYGKASS
ncbi:MAG: hypothetical protein HKN20_02115 [Gemmatimonadetes bacterium]|nr:hypothetical protein [Gemmatimonadota bacterium]